MEVVNIEKRDIGRCVHILSRQIKRKVDESVSKYDVTAVQCSFIGIIKECSKHGEVYAKNIEAKFNMRRATVAEILSLMEKNGLIKRESSTEDARLKKIILTDKSLEIQSSKKKEIEKVENILKTDLSKEELAQFMKTLDKMSKNLE